MLLALAATTGLKLYSALTTAPIRTGKALIFSELESSETNASVVRPEAPEIVRFLSITERPLFSPTRRSQKIVEESSNIEEASSPQTVIQKKMPPRLSLFGIVGAGESSAVLLSIDGASPEWLQPGEQIGEWTLSSLGADWIELISGGEAMRMELFPK